MSKFCHDAAYALDENAKLMIDTSKAFPKGVDLTNFGIAMTVKLEPDSKGQMFTMYSEDSTPVLALTTNPLGLLHENGKIDLRLEKDDVKSGMWHTVAIAVTESNVEVLVNCKSKSYLRRKSDFAKRVIKGGQLLLGQQFSGESFKVCVWGGGGQKSVREGGVSGVQT